MGLIVAAPTAGSSGVIPGVFLAVQEAFSLSDETMTLAVFNAGAIGYLITTNATVSGAEGGCQAEVGAASAMAASAICELMGGSASQCLDAASTALTNVLGLVCDPIAGLVEAPCQKRNAMGASNALISAEMTLCGVRHLIPFDETVEAMYRVGKSMPSELRETAMGGMAATPTACQICKNILN
jgi:L-serine dehydratase